MKSQMNPPWNRRGLARTASQYLCKFPFELPMACEYSHSTTGRASAVDRPICAAARGIGYMGH
jgi:hypothetical protein